MYPITSANYVKKKKKVAFLGKIHLHKSLGQLKHALVIFDRVHVGFLQGIRLCLPSLFSIFFVLPVRCQVRNTSIMKFAVDVLKWFCCYVTFAVKLSAYVILPFKYYFNSKHCEPSVRHPIQLTEDSCLVDINCSVTTRTPV
jgi:hypothetical protein